MSVFFGFAPTSESWWEGSQHRNPSKGQLGPMVAGIFFYHILSPCCTYSFPWKLGRACVLHLKACIHAFESAQVPHDHVAVIEFLFYSQYTFWVLHQLVSLGGGGLSTETPPRVSWGQW
jgi:hypothetical protein